MHPIVICCGWACFLCISLYEMLPRARLLITLVFTTNLRKMLSNNELLSKTITFLRLPLIVGVVFIHTNLSDVNIGGKLFVSEDQFPFHDILRHLLSEELARIAVPLFFFMSGFLFFKSADFSYSTYKNKLGKRIRTLLIPYLFWNIVVLFLFFLTQTFLSSMTSGANKLITDYTLSDWLGVFWNHRENMPICYQFWFIRDLMVVVLCSPLVYWLVRHLKAVGIISLGILWCFGLWFSIAGFSSAAFFFFSFGAWFAINQRNFVIDFKPLRLSFTFFYISMVIADMILWEKKIEGFHFLHNIGIVIGLITVVTWSAYGLQKGKLKCSVLLASSSFFIYAYHGMFIALFVKFWVKSIQPTELTMILGYLIIPFIITGLGIGIYILMLKFFPKLTSLITGGR